MPETTDPNIRTFVLKILQNTIDLPAGARLEIQPHGRLWWPLTEVTREEMEGILASSNDRERGVPLIYARLDGDRARFWPMVAAPIQARSVSSARAPDGGSEYFRVLLNSIFIPDRMRIEALSSVSIEDLIEASSGRIEYVNPPLHPDHTVSAQPGAGDDLEDVLDAYRMRGIACGVQVFTVDHVVCWVGDIDNALASVRIRTTPAPPVFRTCEGNNALLHAAKWLKEMLPPEGPTGTHGSAAGLGRG